MLLTGAARVYFKPNANWNGTVGNAFLYRAWDTTNSATAGSKVNISATGGSTAYSVDYSQVGITVNAVNDAPTGTSSTITVLEDGSKTFAASDFGFNDVDGNALSAVIITTFPTAGTLKLNGTAVTANQSIAVADLGNLVYAPVANANGTGYTTIGFKVQDNGGTANSGVDTSTTANTLTINVTAVNDAPVLVNTSTITYVENGAAAAINASIALPTDVDNTTSASAKVSITSGFEAGKDVLGFTNNASMGNIAASYDSNTGIMTLTSAGATATLANWQAALRAVNFNSTTDNPLSARTVSFVLNDGTSDSNVISSTVNFTAVNDAPINTVPTAQTGGVGIAMAITGLSIADADADANSGNMQVTLSMPVASGVINVSGGSATISGNGTSSVVLTGTLAAINATLAASVTYTLAANAPVSNTLTMVTTDNGNTGGTALTDTDTVTLTAQNIVITNTQVTQYSTPTLATDTLTNGSTTTQVTSLTTSLFTITTAGLTAGFASGYKNGLNYGSYWYNGNGGTGGTGPTYLYMDNSGDGVTPFQGWSKFSLTSGYMSGTLKMTVAGLNVTKMLRFLGADGLQVGADQTLASTGGDIAAPRTFTIPSGAVKSFIISGGVSEFYQLDDISMNVSTASTTTVNNALTANTGTSTAITPVTVNGTLNVALAANEVVEVFRNGVSIGNATVTGTTWKMVDSSLNTVQTDLYEARIKNTSTSTVVADSNDYVINPGQMTAAISMSDTTLLVGETSTVTFTFSEAPLASSFVLADITAGNGTVTNLVQTSDPKVWTALYTPTANLQSTTGNLISLASSSYTGLTGAVGQAASSAAFVVDTKAPVATLAVSDVTMDNVVSGSDAASTVTVKGTVTGEFVPGDVVTLTVNGTGYSGTVNASGVYAVDVPGAELAADSDKIINATLVAHDVNGNPATVSVNKTYTYSAVVPTITDVLAVKNSSYTVVEDMNSAVQVDAYTVKTKLWTITTTAGSLGQPTVTLKDGSTAPTVWGTGTTFKYLAIGEAGASSAASSTGSNTGATIKFVANEGATGNLYNASFTYGMLMSTASVTYYDENGTPIVISGSAMNASTSQTAGPGTSYSVYTPYLNYASYFVLSNFGNEMFYISNGTATYFTGTTTPVLNGASANLSSTIVNGTLSTTLAANEVLEVFRNGVSVGNATVTGATWSIVDTGAMNTTIDVYTARVKNTTTSTYLNASNLFTINPVPELVIADNSTTDVVASSSSVTYSFTFDQAVTGFDTSDVTVTNGTKGVFTKIDDSHYTLVVTEPAGSGTTQVVVADASYTALVNGFAGVSGTGAVGLQDYGVVGSAVAKTLTGTTSTETLLGSELADNITGAGGADKIYTGAGDDSVTLNASNITALGTSGSGALVDGGAGTNILKLSGAGITLDLTLATVSSSLRNFSSVDLTGSGNNTLKLSLDDVLSMSDAVDNATSTGADESKMLVLNGDAGDVVQLVSGSQWTQTGFGLAGATLGGAVAANAYGASFGFVSGHTYAKYAYGGATLFMDETVTLSMV